MPDKTLTFILAGGVGSRLHPLTAERAKPAVPFGGKYRIIDFTLANCMHSGLRRVLVLTQYKSHSLHKHLRDGWSIFNPELGQYITAVPAQMRTGERWYSGTADAIYQNLYLIERSGAERVMILSGDHIYRMDYDAMLRAHAASGADVSLACMEVPLEQSASFGIVELDSNFRITSFLEKPVNAAPMPGSTDTVLASMGIYLFSVDVLCDALRADREYSGSRHDFGHDLLPALIETHKVMAYRFGGSAGRVTPDNYWRDVGTIDAYYEANMDLLKSVPPLNLYQDDWPIRTYQQQTPPARTVPGASGNEGIFINSIVAGGSVISGASLHHSILFPKVYVDDEALVEDAILFSNVRVGSGGHLRRCIVDKHVEIPAGETIGFDAARDRERFHVSPGGIVVVPRGYRFP